MLFCVLAALLCQCFAVHHNEVELQLALSSGYSLPYGDRSCDQPDWVSDGTFSPASASIGLYETYTLTCDYNYHLELDDIVVVDIETVFTCKPSQNDNTTYLDPVTEPQCVDTVSEDYTNFMSKFQEQVANEDSEDYDVVDLNGDLGCWISKANADRQNVFDARDCTDEDDKYTGYIDFGCLASSNKTLVGYYTLRLITKGEPYDGPEYGPMYGEDVTGNTAGTVIAIECVDATTTAVCRDVSEPTSTSRLYVYLYTYGYSSDDTDRDDLVMNIKEGDSEIKYRFRCQDGYGFQDSVTSEDAYGYCTSSGGDDPSSNEFSVFEEDTTEPALQCYSSCTANPSVGHFLNNETTSFENIYMPSMKKDETFQLTQEGVACADDYAFAVGAPTEFTITCDGADASSGPYEGILSCTDCPYCYEMCSVLFNISADNGVLSIDFGQNEMNKAITVAKEAVTCGDGYELSDADTGPYQFTCGEGGTYTCVEAECPVCYGTCTWPIEENGVKFRYVDPDRESERQADSDAIPGHSHVEAYCEDTTLGLVGPRYLSCTGENNDNTLVYDIEGYEANVTTTCEANTTVCSAPTTTGAELDRTGNILVGESYTLTCLEDMMFDLNTTEHYGENTATLECPEPVVPENGTANVTNDNLPQLTCYSGCGVLTFSVHGTFQPAHQEAGQAPYAEGETITFACNSGYHLSGDEHQRCNNSLITIPDCVEDTQPPEPTEPPTEAAHSALLSMALFCFSLAWVCTS